MTHYDNKILPHLESLSISPPSPSIKPATVYIEGRSCETASRRYLSSKGQADRAAILDGSTIKKQQIVVEVSQRNLTDSINWKNYSPNLSSLWEQFSTTLKRKTENVKLPLQSTKLQQDIVSSTDPI